MIPPHYNGRISRSHDSTKPQHHDTQQSSRYRVIQRHQSHSTTQSYTLFLYDSRLLIQPLGLGLYPSLVRVTRLPIWMSRAKKRYSHIYTALLWTVLTFTPASGLQISAFCLHAASKLPTETRLGLAPETRTRKKKSAGPESCTSAQFSIDEFVLEEKKKFFYFQLSSFFPHQPRITQDVC